MYDSILVPTDGSDTAQAAVDHAIDHAKRYDAALHTLYVVEEPPMDEAAGPEVLESLETAGERAIQDVIDAAEAADVRTVEGMVAEGAPHQAILDYIDANGIDLVVMGTHGRTGLDRLFLGSVTEKIVRAAPVAVLTVGSEPAD
ncbi:universal stress protein [Halorientalis regularis]|jgi:nucleotide-binding universal stress UspA family protein|uniref:Nucleotide-binding universal stress protein, UspA family n=1 Tax=Halorientalis regularis TaxID=660518 RepID=A0A1G7S2M3_9EURY|nr:universal stress protein [Halorientalis regularis]SDG17256.1 Nucleotide-binding universal stress protein, UspA family [Halorientalis regularis]